MIRYLGPVRGSPDEDTLVAQGRQDGYPAQRDEAGRLGRVMGGLVPRIVPGRAWMTAAMRLLFLLGAGLALGACSKCDVPDFTHWGSPHACDSGTPAK